jgi:hypothetical protein
MESLLLKLRLIWSGLLLVHMLATGAWAQSPGTAPSTESIVSRMGAALAESRGRLRPFAVVRNYKLFGKEMEKTKSEVIADITYEPPDVQHYTIQKVSGLNLGELIVRKILESENDILTHQGASDISTANYAFSFVREDMLEGRPCYVLNLRPNRKDAKLMRGTIWVDVTSYLVRRVEGEPAKPPSWWVHDIHLVLELRDVNGMWLQTALQSTANVRLLGQHTLISRDTAYRMSGIEASGAVTSGAVMSGAMISGAP